MGFIYTDNKQLKKEFKKLAIDNDITMSEVAKRNNMIPQQLNNRFGNTRLAFSDIRQYLNSIDYDLMIDFIPKSNDDKK